MKTYYSPTFLDESLTYPNKKGESRPTGKLRGFVFTRSFYKTLSGKIKATRSILPFSWEEDTDESKGRALEKVVEGMEELEGLEKNPSLDWIPKQVRELLQKL